MVGILKRTWFSAAERDRRITSCGLSDRQLAQIDKENAEADALLRRLRGRSVELAKRRPLAPGIIRKRAVIEL
ncbi:hypothetical protein [Bradyrhizobium sp. CCBAU 45384]|uniref:hypothetical protein n=1 Tax=Bradyrhizobium sp. CCBAU 45384 TaxID=858428 RepID=UPI002305F150|nr:hypothetical protein [Bradyrhizobium sp. CCBAU 45384]MDA9405569.1 hypothetical protein [Bradyrhizobium sp. CCBAU 45384]